MSALRRLSRVAMIPVAPLLLVQGRRLKRNSPRLPDAAAPWHGTIAGPRPLRLLVLGDSTAAGVGAPTQDDALAGNLARELNMLTSRGVDFRSVGANGASSKDLIDRHLAAATEDSYDVVFVSVGANDALKLRARWAFARDIRTIVDRLRDSNPTAPILMSSLPAFFRFELLPNPLKFNLYLHSMSLEDAARDVIANTPGEHMSPPPPPYTAGFFASDLFHPSVSGYRDWARFAIDDAVSNGVLRAELP